MSSLRIKIANNIISRLIAGGVSEDTASLIFDRLVDGMSADMDADLEEIYQELSSLDIRGE